MNQLSRFPVCDVCGQRINWPIWPTMPFVIIEMAEAGYSNHTCSPRCLRELMPDSGMAAIVRERRLIESEGR